MKHYVFRGARAKPASSSLLFEVKVDIQDVRSGFRDSRQNIFQAEWIEDAELNWTPDVVREVRMEWLQEVPPPAQVGWPEFGDEKIIQYVSHYHRPTIWRNYELAAYSNPRETKEEFMERCKEELLPERGHELKKVQEILLHRFLELQQKVDAALDAEGLEPDMKSQKMGEVRNLFSKLHEDMSDWFLREDYGTLKMTDWVWKNNLRPDFQEKLNDCCLELISRYNQINSHYEQKAQAVEPYEVPLNYPKIDIVSRAIVWK